MALCAAPRAGADTLDPATRTARAHFLAGQAYFRQGELRRALAEFELARREEARPELDFNIGLTYERLGEAARAIDAYRAYLASRPDATTRPEVEARIAVLERSVGELVVVSRQPGASLTLDGEPVDARRFDAPLRLTEGPHRLSAGKEGLLSQHKTVRVVAGQRQLVEIDPLQAEHRLDRRTQLAIGLGVTGAALAIAGIALGVYFGTREPTPFDPGGPAGVVGVRPLSLIAP